MDVTQNRHAGFNKGRVFRIRHKAGCDKMLPEPLKFTMSLYRAKSGE